MKLQSIRLHPFAGIADKTFNFNEGLTVICGPNEHGKSTVAKAIRQVLFLVTNLSQAKKRDLLCDVMPVTGSDTIQVTLNFSWMGKEYTLEKKWGATHAVTLRSNDGVTITDVNIVQEKILEMLPTNQAVIEQVLISSQSKLADAVNDLTDDVHTSLSEKLRGAILNGGGISGTVLYETIETLVDNYYGRWDDVANKPEGGSSHGLGSPWKKGAGIIVNAWYKWQEAISTEMEVEKYEIDSNRLQTSINNCNEELKLVDKFLNDHKSAYEAVNKRIKLEGDIQSQKISLKNLTETSTRWPAILAEKDLISKAKISIDEDIKKLIEEQDQARLKETARQDINKLEQVKKLQKSLEDAELHLSTLHVISQEDVKSAQQLHEETLNCKMLIQGQKLNFDIDPTINGDIKITHSGGQEETINLVAGQKIKKDVTGSIRFNWKGLSFALQSANADITTLEASLSTAKKELDKLLQKYEQPTVESLTTAEKQYTDANQKVQQVKANIKSVLGNDTMESLSLRCQEASALPGTRDVKVLDEELQAKNKIIGNHQAKIENLQRDIKAFEAQHQSQENLGAIQLQLLFDVKQNEKELSELPQLPEGFESASVFQNKYIQNQTKKEKLKDEKYENEIAIQGLTDPGLPLSEAKENSRLLKSKFQQSLNEGKAYRRIQEVLQKILASADQNAFLPLHSKTQEYLNQLSGGRFNQIPFDATEPQELKGEGVSLPVSLLSKGTTDILALSLRLAASEVYLSGNTGFVMMDDPLVDMDRNRREASAKVLQEFSQKHQTIIFTCHDEHESLMNTGIGLASLN